ncbi:site-specific DNA-methyltransferase [Sediminibacterium soli]|uniref:site-specific DNA-methyltransferase n=1 Tax=Sediminibacterium soli TaxID=2698829 RepID=UPI00137AD62E|nr:site-specific DNA-methyltransferase [Sediminibacterium soli]NCI45079.1 site-specific DNA-methyltransferase [Sediminibacterium soli]
MPTLHWIGKEKVMNHHRDVPFRVLQHRYGFDRNGETAEPAGSGNKIIHGDNLEALKALLPEYEGRIKCIYIDPPYNTGNENWVYNDNVNDPRIKKWLGEVVGKESEDLSRHDKWLCMMYPRLRLLYSLLREDGAIFISIDDNEQANLKLVCDEIFGTANFVNNIIWQKKFSPQNDAKFFSDNHDFVVCYAKNKSLWRRNLLTRTEDQDSRYKNIDEDPRGVWTSSDLTVKRETQKDIYPVLSPSKKEFYPTKGRSWSISREKFLEFDNDKRIWWGENGSNMPRLKRFLSDVQDGIVPLTIWPYTEVGHNQSAKQELKKVFQDAQSPFETPKPVTLIEKILWIAVSSDDIILDSFAGSGTTGHAVINANQQDGGNRKFILIEMEDYADTITAERVKRVISGYGDTEGIPGAFDFYSLGKPLFAGENQDFLNESIDAEKIREYIWYSETRSRYTRHANGNEPYLLGTKEDTAYYFIYEKNALTTLDFDLLGTVATKALQYIFYADNCLLSPEFMLERNIIFKKIPRDIKRF